MINNVEKLNDAAEKNNFESKESMLCHWCYYWDECSAKTISNPARLAK